MPYLDPYTGEWTLTKARQLLTRTCFGSTINMIKQSFNLGLNETIDTLFTDNIPSNPPLKFKPDGDTENEVNDPEVNYEETWINSAPFPFVSSNAQLDEIIKYRKESFYAWFFLQIQDSGLSIKDKLVLFWHNHFVAENENPHREYFYQKLLRDNALNNFKELTKKISVDTNMLLYLNGNLNTNVAPNENYSRELLELFTIGKGNALGNGDYTNYTELDVVEMAKIFTGWRVPSIQSNNALSSFFLDDKHTSGDKQISHRFQDKIIQENGENEYKDLIDVIFNQKECSKFIARKLYRWFVSSNINSDIEANIITPLSEQIFNEGYNISGALKTLLSSDHFFENINCLIKSPIDLIFSVTKSLNAKPSNISTEKKYNYALDINNICKELEQSVFHHPNVAGWKAYYQTPLFDKTWVNNLLLPKRLNFCKTLINGGYFTFDSVDYYTDPFVPVIEYASTIENASDPNALITELSQRLFNQHINQNQIDNLKDILIPGLPDFEWTVEYNDFLNDPTNDGLKNSIQNRLRNLLSNMVQMSEFQIM